jgi:signal peptidase I
MKKSLKVFTLFFALIGVVAVVAIIAGVLMLSHNKNTFTLDGPAMIPTIKSGQKVKYTPYTTTHSPQRGDIILYTRTSRDTGDKHLVHRVVGLPGDRVVISKGKVTVFNSQSPNGFNPDSAYLKDDVKTSSERDVTLASQNYFVLGDNRSNSLDSRIFGPIQLSNIIGKIEL